jgi:hypothetical protein
VQRFLWCSSRRLAYILRNNLTVLRNGRLLCRNQSYVFSFLNCERCGVKGWCSCKHAINAAGRTMSELRPIEPNLSSSPLLRASWHFQSMSGVTRLQLALSDQLKTWFHFCNILEGIVELYLTLYTSFFFFCSSTNPLQMKMSGLLSAGPSWCQTRICQS